MRSKEMSDYCVDLAYAHVGTGSSAQVVYPLFRVSTILLWCIHGTGIDVYLTFRFASEIDAVGGARFDDGAGGDNEVQRTMLGELGGVGLDDRSSFMNQQELISFERFLMQTELIVQLDGFDSRGAIKVLMATNR